MSQMVIVLFFTSTSFPAKRPSLGLLWCWQCRSSGWSWGWERAALSSFHLRHQGLHSCSQLLLVLEGTACVPSPRYLWEHLKPPSSLAYFYIDSFQIWNSVFRMNVGFSWVLSKLPLRVSCCWSSAVSSALSEAQVRCLQPADAPVPSKSDPLGLIPLLKIIYRCVRLNS